jgi:hypothetical protein
MRYVLPLAFSLIAVAAVAGENDHTHGEQTDHKSTLGEVTLLHAWMPETEARDALVFVEIENEERFAVTLLGAKSNQAAKVELVGFDPQNGEAAYRPMPQLQIASGSELVLAPNAAAFRLSGIKGHLHAGDSFEVHVIFDRGEVPVTVEVEAAGATQHSHAGHNH